MAINYYSGPVAYGNPSYKSYTLDDLEKNEEFQEVSERFLESVGEKSDDVFEYLRDSNFNLYSGMNLAMQSGKFTDQQKKDYAYLKTKFDNADVGSLRQYVELIKDSATDMVTDPTLIAAALATPFTGGTSLAARQAIVQATLQGTKAIAKNNIKDVGRKQIYKAAGITGAEGGTWIGLDNHFKQNVELNTGLRQIYSNPELIQSALIGTLTSGIFGGALQKSALHNSRLNRLYSNDEYRKDAGSNFIFNARKRRDRYLSSKAPLVTGGPTAILNTISEFSPTAKKLGETFSTEFSKKIGARTTRRIQNDYFQNLQNKRGQFLLDFNEAVQPIRTTGIITPENEIAVIRILRGGSTQGATDQQKQVANNLRKFFDNVLSEADETGLNPSRVENYFPRSWNRKAIEDNKLEFRRDLLNENVEGITEANVDEVIEGMLNKQDELFSSHSLLLTQARTFKNMNDNKFEKYLTNDLVPVTTNYLMNAAKTIEHKKNFLLPAADDLFTRGMSNEEQFTKRFIEPIDKELRDIRGKGLTRRDKKNITDLYKSVTGQVDYFDSSIVQGIYDGTKLANAMAYLPLATLSSLSEAFITLGRTSTKSSIKGMQEGIANAHKIFTQDMTTMLKEKHNMSPNQITKEMNQVFIAVDEAMEDITNRISGEGLQNEFFKKGARGFYKFNLLIPWTKTVQLAAFSTGKDLIRDNLTKLNNFNKQGINVLAENAPMRVQNLKSELFDLGVEVEDGLRWLNTGAKESDNFYNEQLVNGAGRFTNTIILPTSREAARVPTYMTNPKFDIFTQFLRYPTVFTNTVLKNFARDAINNPVVSLPRIAAFTAISTNVAKATNYWRTSEEYREEITSGKNDYKNTVEAFQRVGLLGPIEYGVRFAEAQRFGQSPMTALLSLAGPVGGDLVGTFRYNRGIAETAARKLPLVGSKNLIERYTGINFYDPATEFAKERDKKRRNIFTKFSKTILGEREERKKQFQTSFKSQFATGGLVSGPKVPDTKEDPADRVNPFTGSPYSDQMARLGLQDGGAVLPTLIFADNNKRQLTQEEFNRMIAIDDYLKGKGYRKEARAGILGNIHIETGGSFSPTQIEQAKNKQLGYGIFQLTGKKKDFDKWMTENKFDKETVDELPMQIEYMHETIYGNELIGTKKGREIGAGTANKLQESFAKGTAEEIALTFSNEWEKPGIPHNEQRIKAASTLFNILPE